MFERLSASNKAALIGLAAYCAAFWYAVYLAVRAVWVIAGSTPAN